MVVVVVVVVVVMVLVMMVMMEVMIINADDINNNIVTYVPLTLLPASDVAFLHNQHHSSALRLGRSLCSFLDFR